jgi:hypothetical protein
MTEIFNFQSFGQMPKISSHLAKMTENERPEFDRLPDREF